MPPSSGIVLLRDLAVQAGRGLLDAVFPVDCASCGNSGGVICDSCLESLPVLNPPYCEVCAAPGDFSRCQVCVESGRPFDGIRSPYLYSGAVRQAILALKYGGLRSAASQLGDLLADYLIDNPLPGDVVAPVPMHISRQRERGYNQAELLARRVAGRSGLRYEPGALARIRPADPQAGISAAAERAVNVAGSVAVAGHCDPVGARFILVDDVATTGSTMGVCAAVLKDAGAASVWGLTLAVVRADSSDRRQ